MALGASSRELKRGIKGDLVPWKAVDSPTEDIIEAKSVTIENPLPIAFDPSLSA
jgi:hypothetical protein